MRTHYLRWTAISAGLLGLTLLGTVMLLGTGDAAAAPGDPSPHGTPDPNATPAIEAADFSADNPPTYYRDIEPIIAQECMSCHTGDGIGTAYFDIDPANPNTVRDAADYIAHLTGIGYMPPWMPGEESPPMKHERTLTDAEIAALAAWAAAGAPLGDAADRAEALAIPQAVTLRPDISVQLPEPYTPDASLSDDYRCFLLDPGFTEPTFVTGYEVLPDQADLVHHVILFKISAAQQASALARAAEDEGPGWQCFGGPNLGGGQDSPLMQQLAALSDEQLTALINRTLADTNGNLDAVAERAPGGGLSGMGGVANSLGFWTPGSGAVVYEDGIGVPVQPGDMIVMQMHYNLSAGAAPDQSSAVLQIAENPDQTAGLQGVTLVAPVEIPCPASHQDHPACQRENVLLEARAAGDIQAAVTSTALLAMCGHTPEDYATQDPSAVVSTCERPVMEDGYAVEIVGHMHELGSAKRIELNPDTPDAQVLLDIPAWDFHWQGSYQFAQPIYMQAGDTLRVTCEWDATLAADYRYVIWGEGTADEMCLGAVRYVPAEQYEALGLHLAPAGAITLDGHAHGEHDHATPIELDASAPVPSVQLTVTEDPVAGWNVRVQTLNFSFAPQKAGLQHAPGEGHAHLYVDGVKVARVYGEWYHLSGLTPGQHEIRVTLNANSHQPLAVNGALIEDVLLIEVTE